MGQTVEAGTRKQKLSEVVAELIMKEIQSHGWPAGRTMGTEIELMARFNVSRATIAEAVRQVERHGVARMRRGSGGGLIVTGSAAASASRAISTYLELSNVELSELYAATRIIETLAAKFASKRISDETARNLRERAFALTQIPDNVSLHQAAMQLRIAIADASGSPPVALFMRALAHVLTSYVRPDLLENSRDRAFEFVIAADLGQIVEAIIGGDSALAEHFVRLNVNRREERAALVAANHPVLTEGVLRRSSPSKLAEQVAFAIRDDIAARGWPTGTKLGDESELPGRYGVSHWILRQAIRILEPHGIIQMRRGQGGGLFFGKPSHDYTINAVLAYLRGTQLDTQGALEVRDRLTQSIAFLAATRATPEERAFMAPFLEAKPAQPAAKLCPQFYETLGNMCHNQVLGLLGAILNQFIYAREKPSIGAQEHLQATAEAIRDGDGPFARRHMDRFQLSTTYRSITKAARKP